MCGGTPSGGISSIVQSGLSPRVRGNQPASRRRNRRIRSIPACAGEPVPPAVNACRRQVYPRVCGGTPPALDKAGRQRGLSPRVRGNPAADGPPGPPPGSIPACAGEPDSPRRPVPRARVYPRVCGGTPPPDTARRMMQGLSPRVRGNRIHRAAVKAVGGSIPACAGEPVYGDSSTSSSGVYPRVCGGTPVKSSSGHRMTGLSPRVRGNLPAR